MGNKYDEIGNLNSINGNWEQTLVYKFFDKDSKESISTELTSGGSPLAVTPYDELVTINKTTLIELKSIYGISDLRDDIIKTGDGDVTNNLREFELNISGTSSTARISSRERGRYISGKSAEYGIGIRTSVSSVSGDTEFKWGALNDTNGMYFGMDSDGLYVAILDDGDELKIYQENWNVDRLDGTGLSGENLDTTSGNIFNVIFSWYGYGTIDYVVKVKTEDGIKNIVCHRYIVDDKTSVQNPNLPISALVEQTTSSNDVSIFLGGRQFSVLGSYTPSYRVTSDYVLNKSVPTLSTNPTPIMAFKQKSLMRAVNGKFSGIDISTNNQIIFEIYISDESQLTGASWETPTRKLPGETAFEVDKSATAFDITDGNILYRDFVEGGQGKRRVQRDIGELLVDIPEGKILVVTAFATESTASVDTLTRIREEW